jgi:hypothetical protein
VLLHFTFSLPPPIATMPSPRESRIFEDDEEQHYFIKFTRNYPGTRLPPIRLQACLFKYRTRVISYTHQSIRIYSPPLTSPVFPPLLPHSVFFPFPIRRLSNPSFYVAWSLSHKRLHISYPYCACRISFHRQLRIARLFGVLPHPDSSDPRHKYYRIFLGPFFQLDLK